MTTGANSKEMKIIHINDFIRTCKYFYQDDSGLNNGYNCNHPSQEESEEIGGKEIGKCYCFSCPLWPSADLEDLKKYDRDLYLEYVNDEVNDYLVVNEDEWLTEHKKNLEEFTDRVWPYVFTDDDRKELDENLNTTTGASSTPKEN